jgi:hypothetical protein
MGRLSAVGRDREGCADFTHPLAAERADTFDEYAYGDGLDRVEVDRTATIDRILSGLENDLAR